MKFIIRYRRVVDLVFEQLVCLSIDGFGLNVLRFNYGIYIESYDN